MTIVLWICASAAALLIPIVAAKTYSLIDGIVWIFRSGKAVEKKLRRRLRRNRKRTVDWRDIEADLGHHGFLRRTISSIHPTWLSRTINTLYAAWVAIPLTGIVLLIAPRVEPSPVVPVWILVVAGGLNVLAAVSLNLNHITLLAVLGPLARHHWSLQLQKPFRKWFLARSKSGPLLIMFVVATLIMSLAFAGLVYTTSLVAPDSYEWNAAGAAPGGLVFVAQYLAGDISPASSFAYFLSISQYICIFLPGLTTALAALEA